MKPPLGAAQTGITFCSVPPIAVSWGEGEEGLGGGKGESQTFLLDALYSETLKSPPDC